MAPWGRGGAGLAAAPAGAPPTHPLTLMAHMLLSTVNTTLGQHAGAENGTASRHARSSSSDSSSSGARTAWMVPGLDGGPSAFDVIFRLVCVLLPAPKGPPARHSRTLGIHDTCGQHAARCPRSPARRSGRQGTDLLLGCDQQAWQPADRGGQVGAQPVTPAPRRLLPAQPCLVGGRRRCPPPPSGALLPPTPLTSSLLAAAAAKKVV